MFVSSRRLPANSIFFTRGNRADPTSDRRDQITRLRRGAAPVRAAAATIARHRAKHDVCDMMRGARPTQRAWRDRMILSPFAIEEMSACASVAFGKTIVLFSARH
jgi:hypothetical protein